MDTNRYLSALLADGLLWVGVWLCLASVVTYLIFRLDRWQAMRGARRLPEGNLLGLAVFGGWPGALLALRSAPGLRFSDTFRGWLRAIVAAELLFLGMASMPGGALLTVAEGVASVALGNVTAAERDARPGRVVMDSARNAPILPRAAVSNVVTLSSSP